MYVNGQAMKCVLRRAQRVQAQVPRPRQHHPDQESRGCPSVQQGAPAGYLVTTCTFPEA